jgi:hypothetical protein
VLHLRRRFRPHRLHQLGQWLRSGLLALGVLLGLALLVAQLFPSAQSHQSDPADQFHLGSPEDLEALSNPWLLLLLWDLDPRCLLLHPEDLGFLLDLLDQLDRVSLEYPEGQ